MSPERDQPSFDLHDVVGKGLPDLISNENFPDLSPRDITRYQIQALKNNCSHEAALGNETCTGVEAYETMETLASKYLDDRGEVASVMKMRESYHWGGKIMKSARDLDVEDVLCTEDYITARALSAAELGKRADEVFLAAERQTKELLDGVPKPPLGFSTTHRDEESEYYIHLHNLEKIRKARSTIRKLIKEKDKQEPELPR